MRLDLIAASDLPVTVGRYTLIGLLGEGGMARVFRAQMAGELGFRRPVAVKVVLPARAERSEALRQQLVREARVGGLLNHPNVVQTLDCGQLEGLPYIAMELVEGVGLNELVEMGGPLPPSLTLDLAIQTCRGLHHAHTATHDGQLLAVIHRDIKPSNLLVRSDGVVKLVDFGIAKVTHGDSDATASGMTKGTPSYMSPEQLSAKRLDPRSDLFTLGAVIYYALTGKVLFTGPSITAVMMRIIHVEETLEQLGTLEIVDRLVPGLGPVMAKLLTSDPDGRYSTARELEVELTQLLGEQTTGDGLAAMVAAHFPERMAGMALTGLLTPSKVDTRDDPLDLPPPSDSALVPPVDDDDSGAVERDAASTAGASRRVASVADLPTGPIPPRASSGSRPRLARRKSAASLPEGGAASSPVPASAEPPPADTPPAPPSADGGEVRWTDVPASEVGAGPTRLMPSPERGAAGPDASWPFHDGDSSHSGGDQSGGDQSGGDQSGGDQSGSDQSGTGRRGADLTAAARAGGAAAAKSRAGSAGSLATAPRSKSGRRAAPFDGGESSPVGEESRLDLVSPTREERQRKLLRQRVELRRQRTLLIALGGLVGALLVLVGWLSWRAGLLGGGADESPSTQTGEARAVGTISEDPAAKRRAAVKRLASETTDGAESAGVGAEQGSGGASGSASSADGANPKKATNASTSTSPSSSPVKATPPAAAPQEKAPAAAADPPKEPAKTSPPPSAPALSIVHQPARSRAIVGQTLPFAVSVDGPAGTRVSVTYGPPNGPYRQLVLGLAANGVYTGSIKLDGELAGGVVYWVTARNDKTEPRRVFNGSLERPYRVEVF